MKLQTKRVLLSALAGIACVGYSQGTFGNLDFEQVNTNSPVSLTSWTLYANPVGFNDVGIGGAAISVHSAQSLFFQPLQGSYSVFLQGSSAGPATSAAIGQTGQIPTGSLSVRFFADPRSNLQVTFGGNNIAMFRITSTANYDIFGGDVSSYAGQTSELRFIGPGNSGGYFDNIFFSNQPIPEPSALCLIGLGALFCCRQAVRKET